MKLLEVRDLLRLISAYDRTPFPDGADTAWLEILAGIPPEDGRQAVIEHYRMPDPQRITPGDIRKRALTLAARRAPRQELPAAPTTGARAAAARAHIRATTSRSREAFYAEHPEHRPYRPRPSTAVRVA